MYISSSLTANKRKFQTSFLFCYGRLLVAQYFEKIKEYRIGEKMVTNQKGYRTHVSQFPTFWGQNWHQLPSLTTGLDLTHL